MDYSIISASLAKAIGCTGYRVGNDKDGYLVNSSDIEQVAGGDRADEIQPVDHETARQFSLTHR